MPSGICILHVDDEPDLLELVATFLEREDDRFRVESAETAAEGLDHLADNNVDCIVSDYDMPGRNGIEFLEAVREDYPELPFVLFTGKGSQEIASKAISAGVTDYLQKGTDTSQYAVLANRIGNVVEQYRSTRAVAEAEDKLSLIAEKSDDVLFMFSADWHDLLFVNSAFEDIWGRPVTEIRDDPVSFIEHIHSDDVDQVKQSMARLSEGEEDQIEYRVVQPDGEERWVRADAKPVVDQTGSVSRIVGYVRDVTQRIQQRQELRQVSQRFQRLVEHGSDIITVLDEEGIIRYQSPAIERILGHQASALVGDNAFEYIHPEDRDRARDQLATLLESDDPVTARVEIRFRHADGFWTWLEAVGRNKRDSVIDGFVITSREISARKEREEGLTALNEMSQELMAAGTRPAVTEIGVDAASEILGLEANGIHLYDADQRALVPVAQTSAGGELVDDPPTFTPGDSIAWRVYEQGEPLALPDVHDDPDAYNSETDVQSELFLPLGEYGLLIASAETSGAFDQEDVTLGKLLAGTIETALEQVDRTAQLADRERELRRQNERLEEFASVVSHDLRNPLQVADGQLDLAMADCDSDHLESASAAIDRMDALINDLLALAQEGQHVGDLVVVDLATIAERCWANVDSGRSTLQTPTGRQIRADKQRLKQLLENLMRNAIDHSDGEVTVTIGDCEDGFFVADDGPGIPPDERDRVFEAGYSTAADGTGFGLSIVRQVADAHGWALRATASEADGARIEITGVDCLD